MSDGPPAPIRVTRDQGTCRVTLSRPEVLNALDDECLTLLTSLIEGLGADEGTRVVVLRGAGRSFCAGADRSAPPPPRADPGARAARVARWLHAFRGWADLPQVTVGILQGHCIGSGAVLALACDLRLATETLSVRLPEIHRGLRVDRSLPLELIQGELGPSATRDLLLTGRAIGAEDALRIGFAHRVLDEAAIDAAVTEVVDALGATTTSDLRALKRALRRPPVPTGGSL